MEVSEDSWDREPLFFALGPPLLQSLRCVTLSVSVHVVSADPGRGKGPRGEPAEDFLQLSSPTVFAKEIVGRYGNGDHPLRAGWVQFCGRLIGGENKNDEYIITMLKN